MYRVLVVDDEEPVLDSYEFMLQKSEAFSIAGKARSGFEALKLVHELEPDLVFMDINIPGLDGLEVIADVHKKFPAMIFVLSTAYERFDLAQRAIPLGVFAYLVKPVSKKTFLQTLDTVREALQNRETLGQTAAAETESPEQRFFRRTIWKELSETEWNNCREELSLPSDKGITFILETSDPEKYCARVSEEISYKHHCRYDIMLNRGLFLISGEISRNILGAQIERLLREIIPQEDYLWGIGENHRGPELYRSCAAALRGLEDQWKRKGEDVQNRERQRIIQLRRKTGIAEPSEVEKMFSLFWRDTFAAYEFNLAKAKMVSLFMFLMDDITGCYNNCAGETPPVKAAEEIMALENLSAWEAWAPAAFEKILNLAVLRRSADFPLPLIKAVEYIKDHYAEGLQLHDAACAAQVSDAHLSRLFSEHLKTSFIDYVTELRIEKAETLIRTGRQNMKDIAYAVGLDPGYFSKLFRKVTGLSPTQYAENRTL